MKKFGLLTLGVMVWGVASAAGAPALPSAARALESVPAWFEPNQGLVDARVKYYSRGAGYTLSLEESGAVLLLGSESPIARMRMALVGGNPKPVVEAVDRLAARTDYFLGNQPGNWRRDVPHFARVRYRDAYPGIDLVYYSTGRQLEYDFVVAPGADPRSVRFRLEGVDSMRLASDGSLVMGVGGRELVEPKPVVYQELTGGRRASVQGRYELGRNREVRFAVGGYDRSAPLVIDPVLVFAGYFGGENYDVVTGMAVDSQGNVWLTGTTSSTITLPQQNDPYASTIKLLHDIFVAEMSVPSSGQATLLYYTYLGGSDEDYGGQIALDGDGNVYLTGSTVSADFPNTSNAFETKIGGANNTDAIFTQDAVAVKLNPAASGTDSLVFSSFIGGTGIEAPTALALGPNGTMLVAGYTGSGDIVLADSTNTLQPGNRGGWDAFLYQIDPNAAAGSTLRFNTYFGGTSTDVATGVAVDATGAVYLSGYTFSEDFPLAGDTIQGYLNGFSNLWVAKLDLTQTGLGIMVYSSYLGGSALDIGEAMTMDSAGGLWLTGYTMSTDFPVTQNAYRPTYAGGASDVFVTRVDLAKPSAQAITYSTFFGGSGTDIAYGLALAGPGKVAITGYTLSSDLPLFGALPRNLLRSRMADAFVAELDSAVPGVSGLTYSTYFGGTNNDVGTQIAVGPSGSLYVCGYSGSKDLPTTDGSQKLSAYGSTSGFLLRVDKLPGE